MNKRTLAGIITGLIYGVAIFWGAISQTLPVGGLITLAAAAIGLAGGGILNYKLSESNRRPSFGTETNPVMVAQHLLGASTHP